MKPKFTRMIDGIPTMTVTEHDWIVKQLEAQEPVECMCGICKLGKREWVGLTNEEIEAVMHGSVEGERMLPYQFARAIEAKLKAKNEAP
jgi:uncharacterized protein involved in tellurium resistance